MADPLPGVDALIATTRIEGEPGLIEPYPDPNNPSASVRVWWGVRREVFGLSKALAAEIIREVLGGQGA
jgi:hypothetical protein